MAERTYLGVDLGAESGRLLGGRFDGKRIELVPVHRFPNGPVPIGGTLRWDVLRLWNEIQSALAQAAVKFGNEIVSIGVDTWGVDYVLLSKSNEILGQPYHYRDPRTRGILDYAFTQASKRDIFAETGLQFLEFNTLFQLVAHRRQHPELLDQADKLLLMPDFFHWCLCGSRVIEFTNATTTQCYHPTRRDWSFDLLKRLDLPTHLFPEVVATGTPLGRLRDDIAQRTGLKRVDVIASATHDTGAAVAAVPTQHTGRPDWAYISSGTWSLMGVEVQDAILSPRALELNVTNEGGIDGTYRLLKNIMGLWLVQECRRSFERRGRIVDYDALARLAADAPPFRSIVDPDNVAFLAPDDMPTAIQAVCKAAGQPIPETEGELVRCALDSLALKYRLVLERLEELTGVRVEVIHIVGGGSQNRLLNQLTANACGRPVLAGPVEATAMGNLLVQVRASGELKTLSDIRDVVRASSEIMRFEPTDRALAEDAYARFRAIAP